MFVQGVDWCNIPVLDGKNTYTLCVAGDGKSVNIGSSATCDRDTKMDPDMVSMGWNSLPLGVDACAHRQAVICEELLEQLRR